MMPQLFGVDAGAYAVDAAAAFTSAFTVAPLIAGIDQAIVQNASGRSTLGQSLASSFKMMVSKPHHFVMQPASLMLWGVYGGTYVAVNWVTSICDAKDATALERNQMKFGVVSSVNLSLNITKDKAFTRMFGTGLARPVPLPTIAAFGVRDSLTVFASFNLAPLVGALTGAPAASQLVCPVAMQFVSAPIHLWGLDTYNRPGQTSASRAAFINTEYVKTALARCGRILPAFGICPLVNARVRTTYHAWAGTLPGLSSKVRVCTCMYIYIHEYRYIFMYLWTYVRLDIMVLTNR